MGQVVFPYLTKLILTSTPLLMTKAAVWTKAQSLVLFPFRNVLNYASVLIGYFVCSRHSFLYGHALMHPRGHPKSAISFMSVSNAKHVKL